MAQELTMKIQGLYTNPNAFSEVPKGGLVVADNIVIDKESIAETRRGQATYGAALSVGSNQINKLYNYRNALLVHYDNKLAYDSDNNGTWTAYSGTYSPPTGYKIRGAESNRNFYFTTTTGIKKLNSITGPVAPSGAYKGLDGFAVTTGSSGFMADNTQIAYRIVWAFEDVNKNLIIGAPSQRITVANSSGGTRNITLTFTIPDGVTTDWTYQIYRSGESANSTSEANDELQLVIENNPTSAEITAQEVVVLDLTPNDLKGAFLYTSPSQEGIAFANETPPSAVDIDVYKNCLFFANTTTKQRLKLNLISVDLPSFGFYIDASVDTVSGSAVLTNIASTADLVAGMRVVGAGIPSNALILSVDSATQITMTVNATATATVSVEFQDKITIGGRTYYGGAVTNQATNTFQVFVSGTPAENIADSALELITVINKDALNTQYYAYYISGFQDLPGQILIEEKDLGGSALAVTSTRGESFSPVLPSSGTSIQTDNESKLNRVYFSKPQQPEAVPGFQYFDVGSADAPIRRILALRDSLFIFKDDGIFRLTGEDQPSFQVTLFDNTAQLLAPESAVAFNNQVYCFSDQGVISVSDNGVAVISRPIESTLLELSSSQYTNFTTATFAVGYESARQYMLFTVTETAETFATQAFIFNSFTNTWTRWVMDRCTGIVSKRDNKLYMGNPVNDFVYKERKDYNSGDYADEQYAVNIVSNSGFDITLTSASSAVIGYSIRQGLRTGVITAINGNVITVNKILGWAAGSAAIFKPIFTSLQWIPADADNPGFLKQFRETTLLFRSAAFNSISVKFSTNASSSETTNIVIPQFEGTWGSFPWGNLPWGGALGGQQPLRTLVPLEKQRASWLNVKVESEQAFTSFSLAGISIIYNTLDTRFK